MAIDIFAPQSLFKATVGGTEEAIFQVLFKAMESDFFAPQSLFKATVGGTEEAIFQVL